MIPQELLEAVVPEVRHLESVSASHQPEEDEVLLLKVRMNHKEHQDSEPNNKQNRIGRTRHKGNKGSLSSGSSRKG